MKKFFFFLLLGTLLPGAVFAQRAPVSAFKALTSSNVSRNLVKPLSNQSIEALVARGKTKLVLQRALAVSQQRNDLIISVLQDGQVHSELLRQWWKKASVAKYRWEEGNMLGMNSWLMVLSHRIREGIKLSPPNLKILEEQILLAQQDAEREFKKRYQYIPVPSTYENTPAFLSLLGEAVAYRLDTYFLPTLAAADRVRLLQVLMHGMFAGPVDWGELHTAVLYREIRACLHACARNMKQITLYGSMKSSMREIAAKTAREAAENSIISVAKLKEMFVEDLQAYSRHFADDPQALKDWNMFIHFFQKKPKVSK